ncbi:non-ribosomal peptide synthetase [Tumebacillus flagellatus]|uniref:Carrier domain-containing protein n=1 Tax=Tumebacillus flagellatus TaxID=1157490 RepID=A0A074LTR4_9BACL|nr:non-ribosomal peptide synthetase [Tumebacillus flagellatus]KEO84020.1 hypothetical protein EL26_07500 [Tumebacillus flagellatus]
MKGTHKKVESLPIVNLPTDAPRPAVPSLRSRRLTRSMPAELAVGLQRLAEGWRVSIEELALAASHVLLFRYTGQQDLVIGVSDSQEVLASRVQLSGETSFSQLVQSVREAGRREAAIEPFPFQIGFAWGVSPVREESPFELALTLNREEMVADARVELFEAQTVEAYLDSLEALLTGIVEQPERDLLDLPVLSAKEREHVLYGLNDTRVEYGTEECIHTMFERQAALTPDAVALVFEGAEMTYRELNERANQVAHYLIRSGVQSNVRVGICMDRSLEMLVAIYGVMKAGGVYVPIDPYHPAERMKFTMEDSAVPLMLTQARWLMHLPAQADEVICLDTEWETFAGERVENPELELSADNNLSILYTSGSTGKPKGVMSTHKGICNLLRWMQDIFGLTPQDRHILKTPYSFDVSAWELFWPLVNGACLVIAKPEGHKDSAYLVELCQEQGITTIVFAPSMMQLFLEEAGVEACTTIKRALCAGEALPFELQERFFSKLDAELHNLYGPTEASVIVAHWKCVKNSPKRVVPIGYPIANTMIYLLDERKQPVPRGAAGELFIGGTAVARGYLNRPELNEEKFVLDPYHGDPEARMYGTGDLARHLPDGTIDYIGRIDHQVKIRGLRIELGEIESVLQTHPAVREVVVMAQQDVQGGKFLAAFLTAQENGDADQGVLRQFVKSKLPDYMVPNVFVVLEEMPLSPNGKIDRKALPQVSFSDNAREEHVKPRTPLEQAVVQIWEDVLQVPAIGVTDHFFYLGGHSLFANRVVARIREKFGCELSVAQLYDRPTVAELAELLEDSSQGSAQEESWERVERPELLPLTYPQEAMWFVDRLQPGTTHLNVPFGFHLHGPLDVGALRRSLDELIKRHESLRTVIVELDGVPYQRLTESNRWELPLVDVSGLPEEQQRKRYEEIRTWDSQNGFDLSQGPNCRGWLFRYSETHHELMLNVSHILFDARSLDVFKEELFTLYGGGELPALTVQFGDYVLRERARIHQPKIERDLDYWRTQLGGTLPLLELPMDAPLTPQSSKAGRMQRIPLPVDVSPTLRELCREERVTPFMVFLSVYLLLLSRLSGQEDIVVGTPMANRDRVELEGMIGFLLNTIALRGDLTGNPTFRELLRRVRDVTLQGYEHSSIPYEKVVEELQPERSLVRNPFFDVMINYLDTPETGLQIGDLEVTSTYEQLLISKYLMTLFVQDVEGVLHLELVYREELFTAERGQMMLEQLQSLLVQVLEQTDRSIHEYTLVTESVREQWPSVRQAMTEPSYESVLQTFRKQALAEPNRPAVVQGDVTLSYRELLERVEALSQRLRQEGLKPGDVTAVLTHRSVGFVVSALAVLQSGGVLLPVDLSLPEVRQCTMLEQAGVRFVLAWANESASKSVSRMLRDLPWVHVDVATGLSKLPAASPGTSAAQGYDPLPDDPAYLFFTSGTTNVPKGVLGTHKGLNHFLAWQREEFQVSADDRVAQLIHLSFDAILRDLLLPLTAGASLHLPDVPEDMSADVVLPWLEREGITLMHSVPSLAQMWLNDAPANVALPHLRYVFLSGEPLTDGFAARWQERFSSGDLVNFYGPTETTMIKTSYRVRRGQVVAGMQPAGWPQPDTQVWVLTPSGQLAGVGEVGEIVLRTPFASRGYVNAPDEQALRFRANPFTNDETDLVYYTGDRGRYRTDGSLEVLGRLDDQVKVRGVRVQLGEVSAVLMRHPAVASCAVLDVKDAQERTQLAAYVVLADPACGMEALRGYLEQQLPPAMVPNWFLSLERLPLTANGKVDRRALPKPEVHMEGDESSLPARTATEAVLSNIWSDVLGVERVGVNQNFFALGGHSLLFIQVMSRVRRHWGIDLPLRLLFEGPTVEQLAVHVDSAVSSRQHTQIEPLRPVSRTEDLPLSELQKQYWFFAQLNTDSSLYNIPFAVRFKGELNVEHLQASLHEIVRRQESLRTIFRSDEAEDGQAVIAFLPPGDVHLPLTDLREISDELREAELESKLLAESARPFDLFTGPLYRLHLFQLETREFVLLVTMHHIISDGWSAGVFTRELMALYTAHATGQSVELPELPIQYADFAVWQQRFLQSDAYANQLAYWKRQLGGTLPVLDLSPDRPHPVTPSYRGAVHRITIPHELLERVTKFAGEQSVTVQMVMLSAFQALLYARSRQEDLLIGVPVAGRDHEETEGLIGAFINTLVLRTNVSGNPSVADWLHRVRLTSLEAFANPHVPFEHLVAELQPERIQGRSPLFQVMFNYQNVGSTSFELPGVGLQTETVGRFTAKFDLEVLVHHLESGIQLLFEYATDLFDATTIQGMAQQYLDLLGRMTEDATARLQELVSASAEDVADELFG